MAADDKSDFETIDRWLLLVLLSSPVIWLTHLTVSYTLVPQSCDWASNTPLHLVTVAALILTIACLVAARRALASFGPTGAASAPHHPRRRFMALSGVVFGVLFSLLVIANEIPNFILRSCD